MHRQAKDKVGIGDLWLDPPDPESTTTDCDQEKAQILADYFNSLYTKEPDGEISKIAAKQIHHQMEDLNIAYSGSNDFETATGGQIPWS